jgi:hypothetical protein
VTLLTGHAAGRGFRERCAVSSPAPARCCKRTTWATWPSLRDEFAAARRTSRLAPGKSSRTTPSSCCAAARRCSSSSSVGCRSVVSSTISLWRRRDCDAMDWFDAYQGCSWSVHSVLAAGAAAGCASAHSEQQRRGRRCVGGVFDALAQAGSALRTRLCTNLNMQHLNGEDRCQ